MTSGRLAVLSACSLALSILACEGAVSGPASDAGRRDRDSGPSELDAGDTPVDAAMMAPDSGGADSGSMGGERVGVFVANGYAGRTLVSCDDGRTWRFDRVDTFTDESGTALPPVDRCFDGVDCDHHPGRAKGIAFGHGWFFRTTGWGPPGRVTRSRDGIAWEPIEEGTTYGGLAWSGVGDAAGTLLLGARTPRFTRDDGESLGTATEPAIEGWNVRRAGYAAGLFVIVGNDGSEVGLSADGAEWRAPRSIDVECGAGIQNDGGIAAIGDVLVIAGGNGSVCRSTDAGETWSRVSLPGGATPSSSDILSTGTELLLWADGALLRSSDGASWTSTPTEPRVQIGAVARSASGTFVAVRGGWNNWYESQRFYRSEDGVRWQELAASDAPRGHPIGWIAWGEIDAALACRE